MMRGQGELLLATVFALARDETPPRGQALTALLSAACASPKDAKARPMTMALPLESAYSERPSPSPDTSRSVELLSVDALTRTTLPSWPVSDAHSNALEPR
jgi:hypothetical protein